MKNVLIVLCYNDDSLSVKYLSRVAYFDSIDRIVVIDNGSSKDIFLNLKRSIDELKNKKIVLIRNEENLGYAKGNNIGIRYAIENFMPDNIIVSNTDIEYEESVIVEATSFLESVDNVGIISPKMVTPDGKRCLSAWKLPTYLQMLWNSNFVLKKMYNPQEYKKLVGYASEVDVLPGSFLIGKTDTWIKAKGFDEDTFLYGEESLLAYKVKKCGMQNFIINDLIYVHNHSSIINKNVKSFSQKMYLLLDANMVYLRKCLNINCFQEIVYKLSFRFNLFFMIILRKVMGIITEV